MARKAARARRRSDGFVTEPHFEAEDAGKLRVRPELFADHYSQATLFWKSQTDSERAHIASSFVFELSKVDLQHVAPRMIANLRNVDEELAQRVAKGLGVDAPKAAKPARAKVEMPPSPRCRSSATPRRRSRAARSAF